MAQRPRKRLPLSSSSIISAIGESAAATTTRNREHFLATALRSGRIRPEQLGPGDRSLLHLPDQQASVTGGGGGGGSFGIGPLHIGGAVGQGIGNFFGGAE